jgi:beta-lactamase superfamily II metal-dependent hydrolase
VPGDSTRAASHAALPQPAKIVYVNVGQGDAVVMRIGRKIIVSDAGEHRVENVDEALRSLTDEKRIDVAIFSHPHDDHVKSFTALLERFGWDIELAVLFSRALPVRNGCHALPIGSALERPP